MRPLFPDENLNFRLITLKEPLKREMIIYLENEASNTPLKPPSRLARIQVVRALQLFELIVDLDSNTIVTSDHLKGRHSYIDSDYMQQVEASCIADGSVQAEIAKLNLPSEATVYVEAWAYATDGENDMSERTTMVSLYFCYITLWSITCYTLPIYHYPLLYILIYYLSPITCSFVYCFLLFISFSLFILIIFNMTFL